MTLPDVASLEALSLGELRDLIGLLVGEVRQLQSANTALQAKVEVQQASITALQAENQALCDEVARLKGLPPRPPLRPSGMEQATQPGAGDKDATRSKQRRGAKRDRQAITAERVLKAAAVPAGSRFKGYEDILVRDLRLSAEVIRYRRERWLTPSGETLLAALPAGIVGGFGPELRRVVLALHAQGQVTTERLTAGFFDRLRADRLGAELHQFLDHAAHVGVSTPQSAAVLRGSRGRLRAGTKAQAAKCEQRAKGRRRQGHKFAGHTL